MKNEIARLSPLTRAMMRLFGIGLPATVRAKSPPMALGGARAPQRYR